MIDWNIFYFISCQPPLRRVSHPLPDRRPSSPFPTHNEEVAAFSVHRPANSRGAFSSETFAAGKLYTPPPLPCARFPISICGVQSLLRLVSCSAGWWGLWGAIFGDTVGVLRFPLFWEGLVQLGKIGFHTVEKYKSPVWISLCSLLRLGWNFMCVEFALDRYRSKAKVILSYCFVSCKWKTVKPSIRVQFCVS